MPLQLSCVLRLEIVPGEEKWRPYRTKTCIFFLLNCHLPHRPSLCKEDVPHFVLQTILSLGPALLSAIADCHGWEHPQVPSSAGFLLGLTNQSPWQETRRQEKGISEDTSPHSTSGVFLLCEGLNLCCGSSSYGIQPTRVSDLVGDLVPVLPLSLQPEGAGFLAVPSPSFV